MRAFIGKAALAALCLTLIGLAGTLLAEDAKCLLKEGGKLAVIGDSITEQKLYSKFIETYMAACHPELKQDVCQFGWGGERASGFLGRMDNDMLSWFTPDVATICYGMNDGQYTKIRPDIEKAFEDPSRKILEKLKAAGTVTVLGGPGAVDTKYFRPDTDMAAVYNENLAALSGIAAKIAPEYGAVYTPLHKILIDAMAKAKAANGDSYAVCGTDGVHPGPNGHLGMAYAFLKGMGANGEIATIKLSMHDHKAELSPGHTLISFKNGVAEIESSRYPFCFYGGPKEVNTAAMLPYIPFNEDLNRFTLQVSSLAWKNVKVTWGNSSKTFTKEELEKGVNLAAEFVDANPFKDQFAKIVNAVGDKENFETAMIKTFFNGFPRLANDPDFKDTVADFKIKLIMKRAALGNAVASAAIPIKHSIKIEKAD